MSGSASLPHRSVANIRSPGIGAAPASGSPHTPMRNIASTFASPSGLRADEEILILELGTRKLRIGFAGDAGPRGTVWFGPDLSRRAGDYRAWVSNQSQDWRQRSSGVTWGRDHELWQLDVRNLDLGLVGDKLERALRDAVTKYLLVDSRPRRIICVLSTAVPTPLLSAVLDCLFDKFQAPTVSLFSSSVTAAVAAGLRSALVVDLGWTETVVTSLYEYREVQCNRSVRAGRLLVEQMHKFLAKHLAEKQGKPHEELNPEDEAKQRDIVSFEECEEIVSRLAWCKPSEALKQAQPSEGLATVHEQDEAENQVHEGENVPSRMTIPLKSTKPPTALELSHEDFSEPVEETFFASSYLPCSFDDHELPVHQLLYRALLQLPLDVRSLCMSRIIFTGGCANVLGLRARIFDDVLALVHKRGWDPVQGHAVEQLKANSKLKRGGSRQAGTGPTVASTSLNSNGSVLGGEDQDGVWHDAANATHESDPIEEQLKRRGESLPQLKGQMRAVESLGSWSGASLMAQLKVAAIATIDRDIWLAQGAAGASRPSEVDAKTQQRQSMGAGGLMRAANAGANWTLGAWGAV